MSKVTLSEFIIALLELLEAQIAEIKLSIHKSAWSVGLVILSVLAIVVGFIFVLWGMKLIFDDLVGPILSAFTVAIISLVFAYFFAKAAAWHAKKQ